VELEAALIDRLSDDELEASLLHEAEHARSNDPLRYFIAQVALSINPLARLLKVELSRYQFLRETHCDRRAVQRGADPLALARSIVVAATPGGRCSTPLAALGGQGIGGVRVRVQLLLGYPTHAPIRDSGPLPIRLLSVMVFVVAVLPHVSGTGPLDALHYGVERTALRLGLE
jgi:hypothetical protein